MYDFEQKEMTDIIVSDGNSLGELSIDNPILLIFLRHFGCTFCREALLDISERREQIENEGVKVVFVHMSDTAMAEQYFKRFNLEGSLHICDPACDLYQQFGLVKGKFRQLFGLNVFIRGFEAGVMKGLGIGKAIGDSFQMPGVFVIKNGEIRESFIHKQASDRPDYEAMAQCCRV